MKKLIAGILSVVTCATCLTACDLSSLLGGGKKYDVAGATELLDATYVDQIEDGRVDYDVINTIAYQGLTYSIEWSVDVGAEYIVLEKGETTTKVNVNEASPINVDYVLTATVSDPNGNTDTVSFYATLLQAKALIPVAITAKPLENTPYKLYVYNNDAKKDCYFAGGYQATFYLNSVEDYEDESCVDVYVEYVDGSDTLFNLYFTHKVDGKQYVGIKENWNSTKGYWSYNPVIASTPVSSFEYNADKGTIVTTVDACSVQDPEATQNTTKTIYWGNSGGTYTSIGGVKIEDFGKEGYVANLHTLESAADKTPEEKITFEKDALVLKATYTGAQTIEVATNGKRYPDVQITWEVVEGGDLISYNDGKFTLLAATATTTVKVKATLTVGTTTDTKEISVTLKKPVDAPAANSTLTIVEANALGAKYDQDDYSEGKYYVSGTVKSVNNTTYGNLYIKDDAGNEFYVYGLYDEDGNRYDAMTTKPAVGDKITVWGIIGKHNSAQMKNGTMTAYEKGEAPAAPAVPEAGSVLTIEQAIALSASAPANKYLVTGEITEIKNTTYGNMYITDGTNTIYVYGLYTADGKVRFDAMTTKPAVGDTITVYAPVSQYNNEAQLKNAWLIAADSTVALDAANAFGKAQTSYTTDKYYVTGTITEIKNTQYGNLYISDGTNSFYVYGLYTADGNTRYDAMTTQPAVGDTVTVYGVLGQYNGSAQMKNGWMTAHTPVTTPPAGDGDDTTGGDTTGGDTTTAAKVATFTFGADEPNVIHYTDNQTGVGYVHGDGTDTTADAEYSETSNGYTLSWTGAEKVYNGAFDEKGNSCLKFGTSSKTGSISFTVGADVKKVVIYVAQYKTKTTKVKVNGVEKTITTSSNNGEYTAIEIDTTTTKTVTFETVSGGVRCMLNTIEFYA